MILTKPPEMGEELPAAVQPPTPKVIVPPFFDFPPPAARTRLMESSYNMMFGKMVLRDLFDNYFEGANHFSTRMLMLNMDSLSDFVCNVASPFDQNSEEGLVGNADFRLERVGESSQAIFDICVSNTEPPLRMRSSLHFRDWGLAVFWKSSPLLSDSAGAGDDGIIGFTCGSGSPGLFIGATTDTNNMDTLSPQTAWLVSKIGVLTAGVQYEQKFRNEDTPGNLENWSCAISYGRDIDSPLTPSFNFGLQLASGSQFIVSFYQHLVIQRPVINPFEKKEFVRITNYLDFGVELQTRLGEYKNKIRDSTIQIVASWQANKNILVKGKMGPLSSSIALVFKAWWKPALTFNILAVRDRTKGETSFGFGFQVDCNPKPRYQVASQKYEMYTPNMEHPVGSREAVIQPV